MTPIAHTQAGLIVMVKNFDACVAFYRELFGLKCLHEKAQGDFQLACLEFGSGYLMIESAPSCLEVAGAKGVERNPTTLRFNVPDIDAALERVHAHGLEARVVSFEWGTTIDLTDPDGNRVSIRDARGFDEDCARFAAATAG